jgi:tetratricopeptide (TPR) repeat protein
MNTLLQDRFSGLSALRLQELKNRSQSAPKHADLIRFLELKKQKRFTTTEIVQYLYPDAQIKFETRRNRYFKLRKEFLEWMETGNESSNSSDVKLLEGEERFLECRRLVSENHLQLALTKLNDLLDYAQKRNIFEIISDALALKMYVLMALSKLSEADKTANELITESEILKDLHVAQALSRKAYVVAVGRDRKKTTAYLKRLLALARKHKSRLRFKLIYHFASFATLTTFPGSTNSTTLRHLSAIKKILKHTPEMPINTYEPSGPEIIEYHLSIGESTLRFMRGDLDECYELYVRAGKLQDTVPNLRWRKSESFYANKVMIEIATNRLKEALQTCDDLIMFHKEQSHDAGRNKGYVLKALVYTYGYPKMQCADPDFLIERAKTYIKVNEKASNKVDVEAKYHLAVFLFMLGRTEEARKLIRDPEVMQVVNASGAPVYYDLLQLSDRSSEEEIKQLHDRIKKEINAAVSTDVVYSLQRAERLLEGLLKERK